MRNVTTAKKGEIRTKEFIHRDGMTVTIGDSVRPKTTLTAVEIRNSQKINESKPYNKI